MDRHPRDFDWLAEVPVGLVVLLTAMSVFGLACADLMCHISRWIVFP